MSRILIKGVNTNGNEIKTTTKFLTGTPSQSKKKKKHMKLYLFFQAFKNEPSG